MESVARSSAGCASMSRRVLGPATTRLWSETGALYRYDEGFIERAHVPCTVMTSVCRSM